MSASAIANIVQDPNAFVNKKHPHKQHQGGLSSHPAEPESEVNVNKLRLEDPIKLDRSEYLSNATYSSSKPSNRDAAHDESVYSTPVGQGQAAQTAIDTPLPASATKKDLGTFAKDTDDYRKVVKVTHDHTAKEPSNLPERESILEPTEETTQASCCCGHKAITESAAAEKTKGVTVEKPAEQESDVGESKEKSEGQEEKGEGDNSVIVTIRATERAADPASSEVGHVEKVDDASETVEKGEKDESTDAKDSAKAE